MISVSAFMCAELVAAGLLALWVVARYPRLGPRSLRSALVLVGVAFLVLQFASFSAAPLAGLPYGVYIALFGCVLPSFFTVFLAAAWLMRLLAGALGGSGGGPGHRATAPSRS